LNLRVMSAIECKR